MIYVFIVFTIADFLITSLNINHPCFYELNPIARYSIEIGGIWGVLILKAVTAIPFIVVYRYIEILNRKKSVFVCNTIFMLLLSFWFISWGTFIWYNI